MRRTFYGWSLSARTPIISNDPSQSQSRAVASGTASNNNTSVHRSIEQPSATKRSRIDFEDDDNNDLRTSGVGDIDWPDERGSIIVNIPPSIVLHRVLFYNINRDPRTLMRSLRAWKIALMIFLFLLNSISKDSSLLINMATPHL
jgi:hypothetical protein